MINYLNGKVTFSNLDIIEFEVCKIGYRFEVVYLISKDIEKIYLFELKNDYEIKTFAFGNEFDRDVFSSLVKLKGVGTKTIRRLFTKYSSIEIQEIVINKDINKLLIVNGIGLVMAKNIMGSISNDQKNLLFKEIYKALKTFGYCDSDLNNLSSMIDENIDTKSNIEMIIKKL